MVNKIKDCIFNPSFPLHSEGCVHDSFKMASINVSNGVSNGKK